MYIPFESPLQFLPSTVVGRICRVHALVVLPRMPLDELPCLLRLAWCLC